MRKMLRGSKIPAPDFWSPLLPSAGCARATQHEYIATEEIDSMREGHRSYQFVFKCAETGALRRWGVAHVEVS